MTKYEESNSVTHDVQNDVFSGPKCCVEHIPVKKLNTIIFKILTFLVLLKVHTRHTQSLLSLNLVNFLVVI